MSFFDQPYYALTKTHMSRMGIWPEQSRYVRIIRLLTMFIITMTIAGPMLIRLRVTWRDINTVVQDIPQLVVGSGLVIFTFRYIQNFDRIKLTFKHIEGHWEMFKNTSAVVVLDKYTERGRYYIAIYATYIYVVLTLYLVSFLSPIILDFVSPVNETRPKMYILINVEYGIDVDKYYWFILAHQHILTIMATGMLIAMETMYFLLTVHACALFDVVGFNLQLVTTKYAVNKEKAITFHNDWNYKKIGDCIIAHEVALSFADLIENIYSGIFDVLLGATAIMIIFSGVLALIHLQQIHVLIQSVAYAITQVFHLYLNTIPGQELINRSQEIHTTAYDLDWQEMPVKAQKLLIPILIRSNKPCHLSARKVYVISMESFGSTMRTVISYFMIFAQLI